MKVTLQPSGAVLDVQRGERILDAARRLGYDCPQACRNGNCLICAALLVSGRVRQRGESHDHGEIFTCLAEPEEDCVLLWDGVLAPGELPVRTLSCQLISCEAVGGDVFRLLLRAPAGKPLRYHAGQYLLLEREDGEFSAFSLASAPARGRELELHVLAREPSSIGLLDFIRRKGMAKIQMPFGDTHLAELPDGPLVLIAAGTGMAQMHSLIEYCRGEGFAHPVHLYWGVRRPEDFYQLPHWEEWRRMPNLSLHQVVSDVCGWQGRCGMLHEAVCEDFTDLKPVHVYASGSPAMIYGTLDALVEAGMDAAQMRADVFAYAPREP
ncbi:CDP-6-deoxy-delta-3,4-glucoseen reductase [Stutzerimonas stutzeri]|uniref:CDP-6-deoxy-delta-3,4-glucoseen reductase n=1 Tax=Stutzerimonas stutzeri TaxID=316 RepID=W8R3F2_STUST|nr:CDP-6-deoxy-delta-3,4-glucoseen reductase [Stutzerimonas stutzeri]AHL74018.1 CDP-6-deoxy-delta-3,4-glucoseen reductase [Stutzerimonas stutzeri]MCQ4328458.1 CDP-6-deoxy-delta-3,4-glucoseen reductase [Stutzerimonas stutzeri]